MSEVKTYACKELEAAPCIFMKRNTISICYVDDLLVFAKYEININKLKFALVKKLAARSLRTPRQCQGFI